MFVDRVLSGMRPTGMLHLGHYQGVLKNWVRLQHEHECLFFVADWHALTTHYDDVAVIEQNVWDMVVDWIAAGVDPSRAVMFIQSQVPEHAELHLLLSMMTPLGWLERVPTYKDQQEKLSEKDLSTYGFLGYPLLQSADILIYRAKHVPVGEDQVPHIEFTREIARRFNHLYGKEPGFEQKAEAAIRKLGSKKARLYEELRDKYFNQILKRFEARIGQTISDNIVYKKSYSVSDFRKDYHAFKGNAYGLANTLLQTAILKPSCKSKKLRNLYFTGQLTVPGPGVPPSLISGEVVAKEVRKAFAIQP